MFLTDEIEVLRPDLPRGRFRSVLFDFDGTLSLIREGWPQVMIPMMTAVLRETGTSESDAELTAAVSCASVSAVPVARSAPTIIGIITCGQPSRISDRVPSKSNSTKR